MQKGHLTKLICPKIILISNTPQVDFSFPCPIYAHEIVYLNISVIEYIYEITPYYDKEKKKNCQKSKYLGKKGFDVLKNDIELMPTNLGTDNSLKGYLFIAFVKDCLLRGIACGETTYGFGLSPK